MNDKSHLREGFLSSNRERMQRKMKELTKRRLTERGFRGVVNPGSEFWSEIPELIESYSNPIGRCGKCGEYMRDPPGAELCIECRNDILDES